MTILDILREGIELGVQNDFRPRGEVFSYYWQEKINAPGAKDVINPYADTGVVYAPDLGREVKRVVVGLDVGQSEVLSIGEWEAKSGKVVDCIIAHHPHGKLMGSFPHIIKIQIGNLNTVGVSTKGLEKLYDAQVRADEEHVRDLNIYRIKNILELLDKNYICIHTPADNMGARYVQSYVQKSGARTLGECEDALMEIPEYQMFFKESGVRPVTHVGKGNSALGKYLLTEFTGGEDGPIEIYDRYKKAGVSTIIVMHISPQSLRRARKARLNVISAGHITSDSVGLNLLSDFLEQKGIEVVPLGGFIRHSRSPSS